MNILLRKLIREVITASSSTSASTDTAPDSSSSDKNDGGDKTSKQPEVAVEEYISSTYNAVPAKQDDEAKKLASTLKSNGIDTHDKGYQAPLPEEEMHPGDFHPLREAALIASS